MTWGDGNGSEGGYEFIPSPQYHNPDPLVLKGFIKRECVEGS